MYAWLVATCLLHFWQNDRLFTCHGNTGVERTPNKSQHAKITLTKTILPPPLLGIERATFRSLVRRSKQQAIQAHRVAIIVVATASAAAAAASLGDDGKDVHYSSGI